MIFRVSQWSNHFKFQEACAAAFVEPSTKWLMQRKAATKPNHSSQTPTHPKPTSRSVNISTSVLCQRTGKLKSQLDMSLPHLPIPVSGKKFQAICQLHHWVHCAQHGEDSNTTPLGRRSNVMARKECNFKLCLCCLYLFHKNENTEKNALILLSIILDFIMFVIVIQMVFNLNYILFNVISIICWQWHLIFLLLFWGQYCV